jgi:RNA polymerase sigma factor (sigma-70 family)
MTTASTQSDLILLRRFAEHGDHEAFAQLARRHAGLVYATCRRVLGDRERAEEVSQEIFFRLVQAPQSVKRSVAGWLHRTATRLAIDVARSDASRRRREVKFSRLRESRPPRGGLRGSWVELSPIVDECLAELPERARCLLVEHYLVGRTQTELAEDLRVSVSTVSRRIQSAISALRDNLGKRGVEVGAAALGVLILDHAVEAAPQAVVAEVGKMTLVIAGASGGSAVCVSWSTVAAVALALMMLLAALATVAYVWHVPTPGGAGPSAPPPAATNQ